MLRLVVSKLTSSHVTHPDGNDSDFCFLVASFCNIFHYHHCMLSHDTYIHPSIHPPTIIECHYGQLTIFFFPFQSQILRILFHYNKQKKREKKNSNGVRIPKKWIKSNVKKGKLQI